MRFSFVGSHFIPVVEKGEGSKRCCCDCQASASEPVKEPEVCKGALTKEELLAYLFKDAKISFHPGSMVAEGAPAEAGRNTLLEKLLAESKTEFWKNPITIKECPLECCIGKVCNYFRRYADGGSCRLEGFDASSYVSNTLVQSSVQDVLDHVSERNAPPTISQCNGILRDQEKAVLKYYRPGNVTGQILLSILSIALDKVEQGIIREEHVTGGSYPHEEVTEEALTEEELQCIYNKPAAGDVSAPPIDSSAFLLSLVEQKLREALKPECHNLRVDILDVLIRLWAVIKESNKE